MPDTEVLDGVVHVGRREKTLTFSSGPCRQLINECQPVTWRPSRLHDVRGYRVHRGAPEN